MPLKNRYCFSCVWIDLHNAAYVKVFHQTRYLNILPDVAWAQVGTNDCGNFSLRVFRVCRRSIVPELYRYRIMAIPDWKRINPVVRKRHF